MNDIDATLAEAEAAAEAQDAATDLTPTSENVPVQSAQTGGAPMTMEDFESEVAPAVDVYLKVNETGISINEQLVPARKKGAKKSKKKFEVLMHGGSFRACAVIVFGQPAQYETTYNRQTTKSGKSWPAVLAQVEKLQPGKKPYTTADIVLHPVKDIEDEDNGGIILDALTSNIGYTPPWSGTAPLKQAYDTMKALAAKAGKPVSECVFKMELTYEPKTKDTNRYGVVHYENIVLVEDNNIVV